MVATEEEKVLRILDLVRQEKAHSLEGLLATIDIISQEEVVGIGWETAIFKKSEQIVVLPVHIT